MLWKIFAALGVLAVAALVWAVRAGALQIPEATCTDERMRGEAFDIAGFVLEGGERIRVLTDWSGDAPASRFLHEVRDGACRFFDAVLSPDYNEAHRDHLHLDRGPYRTCR